MKNKKALDNIRNTEVGHIAIDYRICCGMWNFTMKPCIPDGSDSTQIAKSIKKRCMKKENKLQSLLDMRFTSTLINEDITTISDFPMLSLKQIRKRITFGSFKLKQCPSYVGQVFDFSFDTINDNNDNYNNRCHKNHYKPNQIIK